MLFGIASVLFRKSRCKALGPNTSEIVAKVAKVVAGEIPAVELAQLPP